MDVEQEIRDLRQRVERTETGINTLKGQFEFISGQLRQIQEYMHGQFELINGRLETTEGAIRGLRADMPGIVAGAVTEAMRAFRQ